MLRDVPRNKVCIMHEDNQLSQIFESLVESPQKWIDNSGKADPPPDYINLEESLMMDVMRVNDTNSEINRRETQMQLAIQKSGILDCCPNIKAIICSPDVRNQCFSSYFDSFSRTVRKHNAKIEKYHQNHPGIEKVVFLICDESEAYVEVNRMVEKNVFEGIVHLWFADESFMRILKECDADCVIWFTPYKVWERDDVLMPDIVLINPKRIDEAILKTYHSEFMIDSTKFCRIYGNEK